MAGDHVAFSMWSVMVLFMPASVYGFSAGDKLLLGAVAALVGGGRNIPQLDPVRPRHLGDFPALRLYVRLLHGAKARPELARV
ncbi:hypothetical protein MGAST_13865 [Mycobacterium gastri 'Wayne']|uniref:Uncharacterized protein n=1 Tax=Mycobacterium gastri TaxID=1777 RepID=A0A1X1V4P6_MYCGS|nr:hypothetical protein MGAST_13865 [Mycobacterium gastri 'Wayne']ORV64050.1 hypothetical protein AWC07_14685 [Mycobacterium gastri]